MFFMVSESVPTSEKIACTCIEYTPKMKQLVCVVCVDKRFQEIVKKKISVSW
jgi:hypothetical protein